MREDGEAVVSRVALTVTKIFVLLKKVGWTKNFSLAAVSVKYLNLRIVKKSVDLEKMQGGCRVAKLF